MAATKVVGLAVIAGWLAHRVYAPGYGRWLIGGKP